MAAIQNVAFLPQNEDTYPDLIFVWAASELWGDYNSVYSLHMS